MKNPKLMNDKIDYCIPPNALCLCGLFVSLVYFAFILSPLNGYTFACDQYVYILAGRTIAWGDALYINFFDHKGPVFLFLQAIGYVLQHGFWGIWFVMWLFIGYVIWRFYTGLSKYIGQWGAFLISFGILAMHSPFDTPDLFALDCIILSIAQLFHHPKGKWSCFLCGILGACAFFSKITTIPFFLALFLYLCMVGRKQKQCACVISYVMGGVTLLLTVGLILWWRGDFQAYYEANFTFNLYYSAICRAQFVLSPWKRVIFVIGKMIPRLIPCFISIGIFIWKKVRIPRELLSSWIVWILVECIPIYSSGNPFGQYFLFIYLAFFLSLIYLFRIEWSFKERAVVVVFILLVIGLYDHFLLLNLPKLLVKNGFYHPSAEQIEMVKRIEEFPGVKLWLHNCNTELFLWTNRRGQSRFYYTHPLAYMLGKNHFSGNDFNQMLLNDFSKENLPILISWGKVQNALYNPYVGRSEQLDVYENRFKDWLAEFYPNEPERYGDYFLYIPCGKESSEL